MVRLKVVMAAAVIFLVLALMPAVSAGTDDSVPDSAFVVISLVNQLPEPVSPGESLELKFKVENRGTKAANDVMVELLPRFPFIIRESGQAKAIGSLSGRQKGKDAVLARFFLAVDEEAGSGISRIGIRYKTSSQGWTVIDDFNISIGQRDLPLMVTSVLPEPEMFVPGEKSSLKLEITNFGLGDALNVRARLNFTDSTPFVSYGSANEAMVGKIKPKGKAAAGFTIFTSPDAKSAAYKIPVLLAYSDSSGRNYTASGQSFGMLVGSPPKISASVVSSEPLRLNARKKVTIELINLGLSDLKFLAASPAESENYEIISPAVSYIGDLDSGDSETVSYEMFFSKPAPVVLDLSYEDALNSHYVQQVEVPVRVFTGSEISRFGLEKRNGKGIFLTIAIIIIGTLAYRRLRRKKQK
ncbi:hypothetical protein HYU17_06050 [Candidatus Woesearchaeota archaeon]|nr:hypothetical protein [Candidatus Woesearchaeota archaeon]